MGTTADKLSYLNGTKTAIKNAIVSRGVPIPDGTAFRDYAQKIEEITDIPDLSNPGSASDLRNGKQLVGADGSVITGTLSEVEQATPTISVEVDGLIVASANQSAGIVSEGIKSATKKLSTQVASVIRPGTTTKTAVAAGKYTTGEVQVEGDPDLIPQNIAKGVTIFGVTGTHVPESESVTLTFSRSIPNDTINSNIKYMNISGNVVTGSGKTFNILKGGIFTIRVEYYGQDISFSPSDSVKLIDYERASGFNGPYNIEVYCIYDDCTATFSGW